MNFNPSPIPVNLKQLGNEQKYILRQMANQGHVIRAVMDCTRPGADDIDLGDESGENTYNKVQANLLESMGKRGLFDQTVETKSLQITIATFRLKADVKEIFKTNKR